MRASDSVFTLSTTGREAGELPANVDEFLAQRFGEAAVRRLVAFNRPSVRRFVLAAGLLDEALSGWDGSPKSAGRIAKTAAFYRSTLVELETAAGGGVDAKARAIRARRSQRIAFHKTLP